VGANARGVAELAFGLMLAGVRSIPFSDTVIKQGGWERRRGIELAGRTLGLVGCGAIGRYMAQFASCIGMQVVAYDVAPDPAFAPGPNFRYAGLDEVLGASDVVSLHCPSTGQPLLDASAFEKMKSGVYIINTARHDLIDSRALMDALDSGHVAGAALDVFATEPPTGDPLVIHSRVIATPHLGGFTEESIERAVEMAVKGMLAQLTQEKGAK